jgi:hypothetical protein
MADAKYDVLGIGNAIFDVLVRTDEKFLADHGMTKGGMALIDETRAASIYRDMGPATEMSGGSRPTPSLASPISARAPPMSARSRTTRSENSTPTTSAPPASPMIPSRRQAVPPPAVPTSW